MIASLGKVVRPGRNRCVPNPTLKYMSKESVHVKLSNGPRGIISDSLYILTICSFYTINNAVQSLRSEIKIASEL